MTPASEPSAARQQADEHVSSGHWPSPNTRRCHDCDHVWFRGERRHEYDVDRLDHLPDDHEDVHVVCVLCLGQRQLARDRSAVNTYAADPQPVRSKPPHRWAR